MEKDRLRENLMEEIEIQRDKLNEVLIKGIEKKKIIEISENLDILINKYYSIDLNKKIAE